MSTSPPPLLHLQKTGPLRATPPPCRRVRLSPEALLRRPMAIVTTGNEMRRTASLDTVYLRGLFPRDVPLLHKDRATQTDLLAGSLDGLHVAAAASGDDLLRLSLRPPLVPTAAVSALQDERTATASSQTTASLSPTNGKTSKSSRSSEEGLNLEIERIIRADGGGGSGGGDGGGDGTGIGTHLIGAFSKTREPTPEGRKAPVADILRCAEIGGVLGGGARSETSPRIDTFLSREPPDGCERVSLKNLNLVKPIPLERVPQPRTLFQLKPSSHSAFDAPTTTTAAAADIPKVPDDQN